MRATDGPIGNVGDFYFDDETWVVRYVIVNTGTWLSARKVLVSPIAIGHPDWSGKILPASITRDKLRHSPDIDTDKPVSRQHEMLHLGYYGYPYYWGGTGLWGPSPFAAAIRPGIVGYNPTSAEYLDLRADPLRRQAEHKAEQSYDPRLHSCNAVIGYHIHASDGDIGHLQGMLIEGNTWAIRYIVINTSNWWLGHQVVVAPGSRR